MKCFLLLFLFVACGKQVSSKKSPFAQPIKEPPTVSEVDTDHLDPDQQQQSDGDFTPNRTYNGVNVVISYVSSQRLGLIRIKDKDAEKLHKHLALSTIQVELPHVKREFLAKVGKHINCRQDLCWVYIDFKNGEVLENRKLSESAKAPKTRLAYRGANLEIKLLGKGARIFFTGTDAKALYSVMAVREEDQGAKGGCSMRKIGKGLVCSKHMDVTKDARPLFDCEVRFNHRTGALK